MIDLTNRAVSCIPYAGSPRVRVDNELIPGAKKIVLSSEPIPKEPPPEGWVWAEYRAGPTFVEVFDASGQIVAKGFPRSFGYD